MTAQPQRRPMNPFARLVERFAYTKVGTWLILNVTSRIDPFLSRKTGGRVTIGALVGLPLALLTTTGAKTGLERTVALLFFRDGDNVILIASNGGMERHPGWYFNLRAHPQARIFIHSTSETYHAHEAEGEERVRLWAQANAVYVGYEAYQQRVPDRRIPVMVLTPTRAAVEG